MTNFYHCWTRNPVRNVESNFESASLVAQSHIDALQCKPNWIRTWPLPESSLHKQISRSDNSNFHFSIHFVDLSKKSEIFPLKLWVSNFKFCFHWKLFSGAHLLSLWKFQCFCLDHLVRSRCVPTFERESRYAIQCSESGLWLICSCQINRTLISQMFLKVKNLNSHFFNDTWRIVSNNLFVNRNESKRQQNFLKMMQISASLSIVWHYNCHVIRRLWRNGAAKLSSWKLV